MFRAAMYSSHVGSTCNDSVTKEHVSRDETKTTKQAASRRSRPSDHDVNIADLRSGQTCLREFLRVSSVRLEPASDAYDACVA